MDTKYAMKHASSLKMGPKRKVGENLETSSNCCIAKSLKRL